MIRKTLRNRICLVFVNITIIYLFVMLFILGLTPVSGRNNREFTTTRKMSLYCFTCGCAALAFYISQVVLVTTHPNADIFYSGAGRVTLTAMVLCAIALIFTFYSVAFLNRFKLCILFNYSTRIFNSFGSFYNGKYNKLPQSYESVDSEEEFSFVYLRLFNKVFLVNILIISTILGISFRAQDLAGFDPFNCACFFIVPYMIKSLTSSFLYLGACRTSFLLHKMNMKLAEIRQKLQETTRSNKSHFERMSKFCEISDLIDELSHCYQTIIDFGNVMQELFRIQIVLVLTYSVISTLHEMFSMYQMMSGAASQNAPLDQKLMIYNTAYIVLNIIEIMLVVNMSEIMFMGSVRVGKNVQSLMYVNEMDERLRQSIEIFSYQVTLYKLQMNLFGMHKLDFPLVLAIVNAVISYLVIMVQFDLEKT